MKKIISFTFKLAVSFFILVYVLRRIPFENVLAAAQNANLILVLIALAISLMGFYFASLKFKVFTDGYQLNLSLPRIFEINFATHFYSLFLPGVLSGGVVRWYQLKKENQKGIEAFSTIVLNRFMNTGILVLLGFLGWVVHRGSFGFYDGGWLLALALFCFVLGLLVIHSTPFLQFLERKLGSNREGAGYLRTKILKLIEAFGVYQTLGLGDYVRIFIFGVLRHVFLAVTVYLFARALSLELSAAVIFWVRALVLLGNLLPLSISGLGVREAICVYIFSFFGIDPAVAFVFSMLLFSQQIFFGSIGGMIELRRFLYRSNSK